jgi:hypothetical protein
VGRYDNPVFGTLKVARTGGVLHARLGALHLALKPALPGLFGASAGMLEPPEPLHFEADRGIVHWNDAVFTRVPD